jgi:hypothetical protein
LGEDYGNGAPPRHVRVAAEIDAIVEEPAAAPRAPQAD